MVLAHAHYAMGNVTRNIIPDGVLDTMFTKVMKSRLLSRHEYLTACDAR